MSSFAHAGGTETYAYDDDRLLTGAGRFAVARNAANGLPESVTGGAMTLTRFFNGYGETDAQSLAADGRSLFQMSLARDNAGRITAKTETVDGAATLHGIPLF